MNKGVILTFLGKSNCVILNIYHHSYFANLILRIGKFIKKSLNNSVIISKLLEYNKNFGYNSLVDKLIKLLYKGVLNIFNSIRTLLNRPINNSCLGQMINKTRNICANSLLKVAFVGVGTCILTFMALSLIFGSINSTKILFGLLLSFIFLALGLVKLDLLNIMNNSCLIKILRNFFDYNS